MAAAASASLSNWLSLHATQLTQVPESLHEKLYSKLSKSLVLDWSSAFEATGSLNESKVVATRSLKKLEDVFVVPHVWTFRSTAQALDHLRESKDLRAFSSRLVHSAETLTPEELVTQLYKFVFKYQVANTTNSTNKDTYYYVMGEEASFVCAAGVKQQPNVHFTVFFSLDLKQTVSICWPIVDIAAGQEVLRNELSLLGAYGDVNYWQEHYQQTDRPQFDWFCGWDEVRDLVVQLVPKTASILEIGCGNSPLSLRMHKDGYTNITAIDIADAAVQLMIQQAASANAISGLRFLQMDVLATTFEDASFDCLLDKGTLDAILLGPQGDADGRRMLKEANRLLRPSGALVLISLGQPDVRLDWLEKDSNGQPSGWFVERMFEIELTAKTGQDLERCYLYCVIRGTPEQ